MSLEPPPAATRPAINAPAVVLVTVSALVLVHAALWLLGADWQVWALYALSFIPARLGGGEAVAFPEGAQYWSFLTYALLHGDSFHLASNSIWLLIFSTPVARRWSAARFLFLLSLSAIAGAVAVLLTHWGKFVIVVGASASVSAVLAAAIPIICGPDYRFRGNENVDHTMLRVLALGELVRNSRALSYSVLFLAMTLFTGATQMATGTAFLGERSIAWEAHFAGFIAGLLLFYLFDRPKVPPATFV